jgi:hypothetical protein
MKKDKFSINLVENSRRAAKKTPQLLTNITSYKTTTVD